MAELTERERKLIHLMNIMMNPELKKFPLELRAKALQSVVTISGLKWNEDEMKDLSHAAEAEQKNALAHGMGLLDKYKGLLDGLGSLKL